MFVNLYGVKLYSKYKRGTINISKDIFIYNITIKSLKDEWYLVTLNTSLYSDQRLMYKCDRIDGLFKLLTDKGIF